MRPKSIATVVEDLDSMPSRLSVAALTWVSSSSVLSGAISLTAPTKVVLPTPNPPATSTLSATGKPSEPVGPSVPETSWAAPGSTWPGPAA